MIGLTNTYSPECLSISQTRDKHGIYFHVNVFSFKTSQLVNRALLQNSNILNFSIISQPRVSRERDSLRVLPVSLSAIAHIPLLYSPSSLPSSCGLGYTTWNQKDKGLLTNTALAQLYFNFQVWSSRVFNSDCGEKITGPSILLWKTFWDVNIFYFERICPNVFTSQIVPYGDNHII